MTEILLHTGVTLLGTSAGLYISGVAYRRLQDLAASGFLYGLTGINYEVEQE